VSAYAYVDGEIGGRIVVRGSSVRKKPSEVVRLQRADPRHLVVARLRVVRRAVVSPRLTEP
jgi:hypothetical protein